MKKKITVTMEDGKQKSVSAIIGEIIIGRGLIPNCVDKGVAKKHGLISVSSQGVSLTSIQAMYRVTAGQMKIELLEKGSTHVISDGDHFSFLPHKFCFKIKIDDVTERKVGKRKSTDVSGSIKRECEQEDSAPPKKKPQHEPQPSTSKADDNYCYYNEVNNIDVQDSTLDSGQKNNAEIQQNTAEIVSKTQQKPSLEELPPQCSTGVSQEADEAWGGEIRENKPVQDDTNNDLRKSQQEGAYNEKEEENRSTETGDPELSKQESSPVTADHQNTADDTEGMSLN